MRKSILTTWLIALLTITISGCKKKDSGNWAEKFAGEYNGSTVYNGYYGDTRVSIKRVSDKIIFVYSDETIRIPTSPGGVPGYKLSEVFCYDTVNLTSENAFAIKEVDACYEAVSVGKGTIDGNSISFTTDENRGTATATVHVVRNVKK